MSKLTCFFAIPLPEKIKKRIKSIQDKLDKKNPTARWEDIEKAHITLVYFGRIKQERMDEAGKILSDIVCNFTPFELITGGVNYFYKESKKPDSVLYVEVYDPEKRLRELYKEIARNLANAGFSPAQRITPHITIGRVKKQRHQHTQKEMLARLIEAAASNEKSDSFLVDKINIYESVGQKDGTRYHLLRSFTLSLEKNSQSS